MKTLKEIWKLNVGKFLIIWLFLMILVAIFLWTINDIYLLISMFFVIVSITSVPIWVVGYFIFKKQRRIKINGKYRFKHKRIFEFIFFLFLFAATFFLTMYSKYMDNVKSSNDFLFFLSAGLGLMFFLINAIISGYFHYIFGFHD